MQDSLYKNLILPAYYKFLKKNRKIEFLQELQKIDKLSAEELQELQLTNLKKLLFHCYENIPYYKKMFDENSIHPYEIKTLKDYAKLPILDKQTLRENLSDFMNPLIPKKELLEDSTSGSSGTPLKFYFHKRDFEYGCALKQRSNAWGGWNYWNKTLWLVTDLRRIGQINNLKGKIDLALNRKLLINTKNITRENMFNWMEQIQKFKPEYVYGYSTILANFSEFILENKFELKGIKGVFSTAEPLTKRELISEAFNAPVYNQYGATEAACVAHECKKGNMHINSDEVLVEYADIPGNSDMKKIILTPLYAYGMPLLRYEIEDTAMPSDKTCDCGLSYPLMEFKIGRISDNLVSQTGKIVSAVTLSGDMGNFTEGIEKYQIIQEDYEDITVKLVDNSEKKEFNKEKIRQLLCEQLLNNNLKLKFEYLEEIPAGSNGKLRPIISKICNNSVAVENLV